LETCRTLVSEGGRGTFAPSYPGREEVIVRTRLFDSIVELLHDRQWHPATEVAEKTRYAAEWIAEQRLESLVETDERDGQLLVRLRAETPSFGSLN
jgi:hypothetical protein